MCRIATRITPRIWALAGILDDAPPMLFEPLDPLDEDGWDDDTWEVEAEVQEQATLRRRADYGRHLELAHIVREFGDDYLDQARRNGVPPARLARQEHVLRDLMACRTAPGLAA